MTTPLRSLLFSLAAAIPLTTYAQVSLDFETVGQFSANFRNIGPASSNSQSTNGVGNDYLIHDISSGSTNAAALLYDTTPGDTTVGTQSTFSVSSPLKVEFDFRASTAGSSVGIIFADSTNPGNNMLAIFNIDNTGTTDLLRVFKDGTVTSSSVTAGVESGAPGSTGSSGIDVGSTFGHFSVALTVVGTTPTLDIQAGSLTFSRTSVSGDFDWANTTVILRLYDAGNGSAGSNIWVDNFTIGAIPEPSTYATISGAAVLGLAFLRRRPKA